MDTVIHDGAPNVGGAWASEAYSQSWLVLESLKLACEFLAPRGTFVTKIFRSHNAFLIATGPADVQLPIRGCQPEDPRQSVAALTALHDAAQLTCRACTQQIRNTASLLCPTEGYRVPEYM